VRDLVGALGSSAGELQNLSVAALMAKVAREGDESQKSALQTLLQGLAR
jgi:hypothetical protein